MKIIFLDIDGVLNHERFYHEVRNTQHRNNNIDPRAAKLIINLCKVTGAKIVISSSWRFEGFESLTNRLRIAGIKDKYLIDICSIEHPNEFRCGYRGDVIQRYIDENNIDNYVIIDDDIDMLEHQKDNFIQTSRYTGFTKEDLKRAINILNNN